MPAKPLSPNLKFRLFCYYAFMSTAFSPLILGCPIIWKHSWSSTNLLNLTSKALAWTSWHNMIRQTVTYRLYDWRQKYFSRSYDTHTYPAPGITKICTPNFCTIIQINLFLFHQNWLWFCLYPSIIWPLNLLHAVKCSAETSYHMTTISVHWFNQYNHYRLPLSDIKPSEHHLS